VVVSDYLTGVFSAFAILMSLYHRDARGGGGQWIDLALYESVFRVLEHTAASYDRLGFVREREGNRLRNSAPLDNWRTSDGKWICIVAAGDGLFPRLARAMEREDLPADPRFASLATRAEHADEINEIVADWVGRHSADEIERLLIAAEVPVGRALSIAEIFADPHYAARGDIVVVDDPTIGPVRMQGVYPRLSDTPGSIRRGAPKLGEHNDEVYLGLLGLRPDELEGLRADGIV
jgi:crotonobetainyl-CoA:carnitine CoA-transferase CaiB-like acyl-CoA transferase